jgi:hypothetical protein
MTLLNDNSSTPINSETKNHLIQDAMNILYGDDISRVPSERDVKVQDNNSMMNNGLFKRIENIEP